LTDNGMVLTTRLSGGKGGRNGLEHELRRLGITQKNGKPNHPQTQRKAERFQPPRTRKRRRNTIAAFTAPRTTCEVPPPRQATSTNTSTTTARACPRTPRASPDSRKGAPTAPREPALPRQDHHPAGKPNPNVNSGPTKT
jgi:hypothetical protein